MDDDYEILFAKTRQRNSYFPMYRYWHTLYIWNIYIVRKLLLFRKTFQLRAIVTWITSCTTEIFTIDKYLITWSVYVPWPCNIDRFCSSHVWSTRRHDRISEVIWTSPVAFNKINIKYLCRYVRPFRTWMTRRHYVYDTRDKM